MARGCRGGRCGGVPAHRTQPSNVGNTLRTAAQYALPVAGAIGGGLIGGPAGAAIGGGLGAGAGQLVAPQQAQPVTQGAPTPGSNAIQSQMAPMQLSGPEKGWWESLLNLINGTPAETLLFPSFTPEQYGSAIHPATEQIAPLLQQLLGGVDTQGISNRARRQFQTQTVPSLAERFTAMGGGQRSSAFQGALGQAGSDLESALAELENKYGFINQQNKQQLFGTLLSTALTPQFQSAYQPASPGLLHNIAGLAGQGIGSYLTNRLTKSLF